MDNILLSLWNWITDASILIAPQRCVICGRRLRLHEKQICMDCYFKLPFTNIQGKEGNKIERLFWHQFPIRRASSFLYYYPQSTSSLLFHQLKYGNRPQIGEIFGKWMAMDLLHTDFFKDIDVIVPIPLAAERLQKRGYNQSEALGKGIKAITGIPLDNQSVIRSISNPSQTKLNAIERKENVKNIFTLSSNQKLDNKHVLLIDDIITTGATIISCAQIMAQANNIHISVLSLGLAGAHYTIVKSQKEINI